MKRIRFLIFPVILAIAICFTGDLYQSYLSYYAEASFWKTDMQLPYEKDPDKMREDVLSAAKENQVQFFVQLEDYPTSTRTEIDLYCSDTDLAEQLQKKYYVRSGVNRSVFFGTTEIRYHLYDDLPSTNDSLVFYLSGKEEDVFQFKRALIDQYYGSMPKKPIKILRGTKQNIWAIWVIVFLTFVLLTQYELIIKKKETAFRLTQGEALKTLYFKNVLLDCAFLLLEAGILCLLFSQITGFPYYLRCIVVVLPLLLLMDWILFLQLSRIDLKTVFRKDYRADGILAWSYVLHTLATVLIVFAVSANCSVIAQAVQFNKQKKEITQFGHLNMYAMNYYVPETDPYERITAAESNLVNAQREIWGSSYSRGFPLAIYHIGSVNHEDILVCSYGAKEYLQSKLSSIDFSALAGESIVYCLPKSMHGLEDNEVEEQLFPYVHLAYGVDYDQKGQFSTIEYKDNISMIGFGNDYGGSLLCRNPIVIFVNYSSYYPPASLLEDSEHNDGTISPYFLYKEAPSAIEKQMIKKNLGGYRVVVNTKNVLENYQYYWGLLKHSMIIGIFLILVLLLLELCLTAIIIRFEFLCNGMELALKKIYGYRPFERYRRQILQIMTSSLTGLVLAVLLNQKLFSGSLLYTLLGGIFIVSGVYLCLAYFIRTHEKADLVQILKGGTY